MELTSLNLAFFYSDLQFDVSEMILEASKRFLRVLLFLLSLLVVPIAKLRSLSRRTKRCPRIEEDQPLLLQSATELSRRIRRREISCEDVISAYVERCKLVNPILNAIVEDRFDEAIAEARDLDEFIKRSTLTEDELARDKPLLGLPVTVKQSIAMKGMSHCVGVKTVRHVKAGQDADVVRRVREAGGIPLLVSNTPEMCMWWETYNNVTGATWNPYDSKRTAGGSSGGEAALLGAGASLLSLSSDIAGSARLPAMFCGVFGHKPSPGWISPAGHKPDCTDTRWASLFTIGPMVRYAEDFPLLLRVMCQVDERTHRLNEKMPSMKDIKFFYLEDDCGSSVTQAVDIEMKSAIRRLVKHLESTHGLKAQKANLPAMKYSFELATTMLLELNDVECIYTKEDKPEEWRSVFLEVLRYLCLASPHTFPNVGYGVLKKIYDALPSSHSRKMSKKNATLKKQFEDLLGNNGVLIYPSFTSAAHYLFEITYKLGDVSYMMVFNALGLPVTQCPMGFDANGLPIGLQVVANPGCDRLTIAVAQDIQRAFGGWQQAPAPL